MLLSDAFLCTLAFYKRAAKEQFEIASIQQTACQQPTWELRQQNLKQFPSIFSSGNVFVEFSGNKIISKVIKGISANYTKFNVKYSVEGSLNCKR